jgi:hypothetical protein
MGKATANGKRNLSSMGLNIKTNIYLRFSGDDPSKPTRHFMRESKRVDQFL